MAEAHLSALREAMKQSTPWTCGVLDVWPEDLALFYKQTASNERLAAAMLNFAEATEACEPATFGLGTEDVLDEGYRKAGQLDCGNFAASLDIGTLNILDEIVGERDIGAMQYGWPVHGICRAGDIPDRCHVLLSHGRFPSTTESRFPSTTESSTEIMPELLEGRDDAVIRAELYKLNVYGPGSFFKSHKDTPRGKSMVGSLVIVLPTEHQGGQLNLSHGQNSFMFDSAIQLAGKNGSIAYIAFFSDVTHAVEPVIAGHRVTLTYHLLLSLKSSSHDLNTVTRQPSSEAEVAFQTALAALLADTAFLPEGGFLGFGLEHEYPSHAQFPTHWQTPSATCCLCSS
ncbi:Fe2OG dioxygenase domain-containing protein [Mycena indigotica]|uniref:Fe2OG dioxygenase domain-containing protein n=1 Tax=Mycena indigotica TaxID=2126181 RepID=A0A8H6S5X4_9AGAR|nr:Fe2OG dioxygenase domain-containing protein [Mycena indigotica]KAF7293436.1 Fe2OG dioxygenase domain-containing protein [Mycena indigotica]